MRIADIEGNALALDPLLVASDATRRELNWQRLGLTG
jgi:hypothetical protein